MKPADQVLKELSDLYEFNRRIKSYRLKEEPSTDKKAVPESGKPIPPSNPNSASSVSQQ